MSTYVPDAVQAGLDAARLKTLKKASTLSLQTDDVQAKILRLWDTGFTIDRQDAVQLRGFVDIYQGPVQLFRCLVVASHEEAGEMHYEFKRLTQVSQHAALDFVFDREIPVALLDAAVAK